MKNYYCLFISDEMVWSVSQHLQVAQTFAQDRVIAEVLTILLLEPLTCL